MHAMKMAGGRLDRFTPVMGVLVNPNTGAGDEHGHNNFDWFTPVVGMCVKQNIGANDEHDSDILDWFTPIMCLVSQPTYRYGWTRWLRKFDRFTLI